MMGSDGLQWIRQKPNSALQDHHVQATTKHAGGSLMFRDRMTWHGVSQACRTDGNMNRPLCEILSNLEP